MTFHGIRVAPDPDVVVIPVLLAVRTPVVCRTAVVGTPLAFHVRTDIIPGTEMQEDIGIGRRRCLIVIPYDEIAVHCLRGRNHLRDIPAFFRVGHSLIVGIHDYIPVVILLQPLHGVGNGSIGFGLGPIPKFSICLRGAPVQTSDQDNHPVCIGRFNDLRHSGSVGGIQSGVR